MARQRHKWDPVCDPPKRLVRPVPLDPSGVDGPTRGQARGSTWRRTTYGFYVPASVDATLPEQRVLEKSLLLPAGGAVTGWASLRLWGARFFDGLHADGVTLRPVPLAVGPAQHRAAREDVAFARDRLGPDEVVVRRAVPCTVVERALFDEMRTSPGLRQAVVAADMAAAAGLTSVRRMRGYVDRHPGWNGVPLAREALELADENSRSPRESELRLIWVLDAHLPRPLTNREIFDRATGALLGVADLLDLDAGLVGEFDGGEHAGATRRSRDARRDGLFRDHGLEVFRVTAVDLAQPRLVVERALAARRRAKFLPAHARSWTIEAPESWEPTRSLDEILDERDLLREMHEQWEHERTGRSPDPQPPT